MESKIVGLLKPSKYEPDYFESEPLEIPYFDNKKLIVEFVEAKQQTYLENADRVLSTFLNLGLQDKIKDSEIVNNYYIETLKYGYTKPLNIKTPQDIWNFLTPIVITIQWDENGDFYLCISCECEWEGEHGLQLVFKDGQSLTRASGHDGHFID
jgi:uncharacterized protein VirK/YbjX